MAYMYFNNAHPILYADYVEPRRRYSIETDPVILIIEEVIAYALRQHNLPQWIPPVNLDFARLMNGMRYFNQNFADTVIRCDIEKQAKQLAYRNGFNENVWLEFSDHEAARRYVERCISYMYYLRRASFYQVFSFACYASRIALVYGRHSLIKNVIWALNPIARENLPNIGYFMEPHFEPHFMEPHIENPDVDEGIVDDDNRPSFSDPTLLFVEELINHSLRSVRPYRWTPVIDLEILRGIEMNYFTENLGDAITRAVILDEAAHLARGWSFNEERWLEIDSPSVARAFQEYFLMKLFNRNDAFLMLSFACYCSKTAMQRNRNSLVNELVTVLVQILRKYFPDRAHYRNLNNLARDYNNLRVPTISDDEGIGEGASDNDDPEENNGD